MTDQQTVADAGEFGLIELVTSGLPSSAAVSVGPGDDAAVFTVAGASVCSVDTIVEGVHFRRDWYTADEVGRRAVAQAAADLEAMGAEPVAAVVSLSVPGDLALDWAADCGRGVAAECERAGLVLIGGDTTRSRDVTIGVTVLGQLSGRAPVTRAGARPGDVVAMRGRLGWSAAGLAVLGRGFRSPRAVVSAHKVPEVPYGQGLVAAAAGASAMIDISDGLLADLGHIARLSGVSIDVETARLVVDEPLRVVAAAIGGDPMTFVLTGGEDHALAATFAAPDVPQGWSVIGRVAQGEPGVTVDGQAWSQAPGYRHFGR